MNKIRKDEEIKVGDYVRTKKYGIARVNDIKHCIWLDRAIAADPCVPSYCFTDEEYKNIVKKHSPNIIDLIEVGDYVNGYKVYDISTEYLVDINKEGKILHIEKEGFINATITEGKDEIKSICTKEQFELVEYKLYN